MKRILMFLLALPLFAGVKFGGYLEFYGRYWLKSDSARWTMNRETFKLNTEADMGEHLHFKVENYMVHDGFPAVFTPEDLTSRGKLSPLSIRLGETYADVYDFLVPDFDLRIGRQIVNWGTADKINPTSNINPYDMEDFMDFGKRLPVNAARAFYSTDLLNFEFVFAPIFTPSFMPANEFTEALTSNSSTLPPGVTRTRTVIQTPVPKVSESSSFAGKVSGNFFDWDVSLSYFHGRLTVPFPKKMEISVEDSTPVLVTTMGFPEINVIGADFSGSPFGVGFWGEFAYIMPEKYVLENTLLGPDTLLKKPFLKYVIGGDYTFKNGFYLNFQFIHGFTNEYGDSLNDYVTFRLEKKFLNDRLKVAPLGIAAEIADWSNVKENYGVILNPELVYSPFDNIEFKVGGIVIDGKGENTFARLKEIDEAYIRVKLTF